MFTREVSTKVSKDSAAVTTKVVVDFTGVPQEKIEELASATVIINEQAVWRTSEVIPEECTIKVAEQLGRPRGGGFKATPENMAARINKMDAVEYHATLTNLGLSEQQVEKMVAKKYPE